MLTFGDREDNIAASKALRTFKVGGAIWVSFMRRVPLVSESVCYESTRATNIPRNML